MRLPRGIVRGALGVALMTGFLVAPGPVAAVEPIPGTPIPAEPEAVALPLPATDGLAFDVDGDGVRDLLVVTGSDAGQGLAAVQAWYLDDVALGPEAVSHSNSVPLRRSASVDEVLERGRFGVDSNDMVAVQLNEPAKLFVAHRDGREIPLVATIGTEGENVNSCCLTIWEVADADRALELRLVAETQRFASELIATDMDADGTDELLVTEGPFVDPGQTLKLSLLRWDGTRYDRTALEIPGISSCCATILDAGETDGSPGAEVLLSGPLIGPDGSVSSGVHRVSLRDGVALIERAQLETVDQVFAARALLLDSGPAFVTGTEFSRLAMWSWPRDGEIQLLAGRTTGGMPAAVFGTGSDARIVVTAGVPTGSVTVLPGRDDLGLGTGPAPPARSQTFGRDLRAGSFGVAFLGGQTSETPATPFFGVIPGGLPGLPDVYAFSGRLVRPVSDPDILAEAQDIALLPGLEPIGLVGKGEGWMALLTEFAGFAPDRRTIDLGNAHAPATLRFVSSSSVMEPEINGGRLEPTFLGVAPDPDHPTGLIVGNDAADAEIVGPPGSVVWWSTRGGLGQSSIGPDGTIRVRLLDEAGPNAPEGSGATVNIWVVTPAGHGYAGTWRIRVHRQPPSLAIADDGAIVDFSPGVSGRTVPGATVTVNGFAVDVAPNGTFEAPVVVGLLPTDVRIVAVDPVGNRTERLVSVVWPVDYRRLPFVPFAVLLTVAAAVVLFLRRPDTGPPRRTPDDGATFEEIGG